MAMATCWRTVAAVSLGTLFSWYDFFLHGVMAAFLCSSAIGVMALIELLRNRPIHLGHAADTAEAE